MRRFTLTAMLLFSGCAVLNFIAPRIEPPHKVEEGVLFQFYAPSAKIVYLVGDFNGWGHPVNGVVKDPSAAMEDPDGDGIWTKVLKLPPGRYEYKFVVDGDRWYTDPANEMVSSYGNSVIIVR